MNNNDMMSQAERYRREMMKLYGQSTNRTEPPQNPVPEPKEDEVKENFSEETVPEIAPEPVQEDLYEEEMIADNEPVLSLKSIDEKYPDPVLDELRQNNNIEYNDETFMKDHNYDSIGWISIDVRTGESAMPVGGASVVISSIDNGKTVFRANAVTDESGQIFKIPLPAPSATLSFDSENKIKPYAVYDISVYANGFFRARSVDVPVFAGVTSMQLFNLVPLPLYMKEGDEIITYYNQEPELQ